jgi:sulfur-oxidizing protein SoxX
MNDHGKLFAAAGALAALLVLAPVAATAADRAEVKVGEVEAMREMFRGFSPQGQAELSRLRQDDMQKFCSTPGWEKQKARVKELEKAQIALIKYPADGKLMGNWQAGERVAQTGVGMQFSDARGSTAGGNCYACHQMSGTEVSFGTIGPSLRNFGKTRGNTDAMQRYAYGKIYNSQAYSACSNMPRFGHSGILTEQQMKDLTALLLDPDSPINK